MVSNVVLDIREGDILLDSSSRRYTIIAVEEWEHTFPMDSVKAIFAGRTYSTERTPAISGGKRGAPTENLTDIKGTALHPLSAELANRIELETPFESKQVFVYGTNVMQRLVVEELKA